MILRIVGCGLLLAATPAHALEPVTLQLKWTHAFQFAGYYAAQFKGYYREAGFDVSLQEGEPGMNVVERVVSGQADYGVGGSNLLLARSAGQPVVVLANIFQHSPLVLISRTNTPWQSIHDLAGRRIMIEDQADELLAYMHQSGLEPKNYTRLQHSFRSQDLIEGKVDAMSAYLSNEIYDLDRAGFAYQIYTPRAAGIDFYGDNLFTSGPHLRKKPEQVAAFLAASLKGWRYAMEHPEEVIAWMQRTYPGQRSAGFLAFEAAQMQSLVRVDLVEIGYMHPGRWRHIAETYAGIGLMPARFNLDGFLYRSDPAAHWRRLTAYLFLAVLVAALAAALTLYVLGINRRLRQVLLDSHRLVQREQSRSHILELLARETPLPVLLEQIARGVEASNPDMRCRISLTPPPGQTRAGLAAGELPATGGHWSEPLYSADGQQLGTVTLSAPDRPRLQPPDTALMDSVIHLAAIAIERARSQEALRLSEVRHRLLADHASDVIWTMDLAGHFTYVSPSVEKLRGYSAAEVMQQTLDQVLTPDSARLARASIRQNAETVRRGEKLPEQRHELEQPCKDGSTIWTEVTTSGIYAPSGEFLGLLGVTRDITDRRRTEARMAHMAQHDALTDLPNRTLLEDRVERALAAARRHGQSMALMFLDLDRFKAVNDQYGHAAGDGLLQAAAARLTGAVRASDTVARIGGDEFVVLLPVVASVQDALAVADKIREALAHPFDLGAVRGEVSASIGVAMYPGHGHTPVELLRHADEAMYISKQAGSNRVTLYSAQNPGH